MESSLSEWFRHFHAAVDVRRRYPPKKTPISGNQPIQRSRRMLRNRFLFPGHRAIFALRSPRVVGTGRLPKIHVSKLSRSIHRLSTIQEARGWFLGAAHPAMNPKEARRQFRARNNTWNDGAVSRDNRTGSVECRNAIHHVSRRGGAERPGRRERLKGGRKIESGNEGGG